MTENDIRNKALAEAIRRIEAMQGNEIYERAWRKAADALKEMMVDFNISIRDTGQQISHTLTRVEAEQCSP